MSGFKEGTRNRSPTKEYESSPDVVRSELEGSITVTPLLPLCEKKHRGKVYFICKKFYEGNRE